MAGGFRVVAPVRGEGHGNVEYAEVAPATASTCALGMGLAQSSPKATWFPRTEPILEMRREGREWTMIDPDEKPRPTVILGTRPCDAAAPGVVSPLFNWDYHDDFFNRRIKTTTTVVFGCKKPLDDVCFCTSVGVDPAGTGSGDVLLTEIEDGRFVVEARTPAGEALMAVVKLEGEALDDKTRAALETWREQAREAVPKRFDSQQLREALGRRFNDPFWQDAATPCIACGTCSFVCPTCHCFDIQDEKRAGASVRQKNWDSCMFPLFTLHTSGHNPRPDQGSRWRQRLSHKFRYYPEKFDVSLCTGCGRCIRMCPAGMDMLSDLEEIVRLDEVAQAESPAATVPAVEKPAATRGVVQLLATTSPGNGVALHSAPSPAACAAGDESTCQSGENVYRPFSMRIARIDEEAPQVRTLRLEFVDEATRESFTFRPGQFGLYSAFGEGESTFCIASAATRKGYIECTFRSSGRVTQALRRLQVGDIMGFRGPYGNTFPVDEWKGKNLLFVAGGIALPPVRSVIQYCLDRREDYGNVTIVYGARTSADLVYKKELDEWEARDDVNLWQCIDWKPIPGGRGLLEEAAEPGWLPTVLKDPSSTVLDPEHHRYTAFVPHLLDAIKPSPDNTVAVICGPPFMIRLSLASLTKQGFEPTAVYTTLENRMKCGIGKCGRCNVGPVYVCKEGPVFTAEEMARLPASEM